jgi:hypothetical protein
MKHLRPEDLFRAEKERATTSSNSQHARLLAEAKAAFDKLMAEGQAARKSGRPRKHPLPPLKTSSSRPVEKPQVLTGGITPPIYTLNPPAPRLNAKSVHAAPEPKAAESKAAKPKAKAAPKKATKAAPARPKAKAKRSSKR